jgi:hypothetical protein
MASPEYHEFMQHVLGQIPDTLPPDEETTATPQEIGWWKRYQISRAIHHMRYGRPTRVEIHLLQNHGIPVSRRARASTK